VCWVAVVLQDTVCLPEESLVVGILNGRESVACDVLCHLHHSLE